jgi:hypothetical protein
VHDDEAEFTSPGDRHPMVYTDVDLEAARKAGFEFGAAQRQKAILDLVVKALNELRDAGNDEPTESERTLAWVARQIRGTDD